MGRGDTCYAAELGWVARLRRRRVPQAEPAGGPAGGLVGLGVGSVARLILPGVRVIRA